jgi:hypothetical protein
LNLVNANSQNYNLLIQKLDDFIRKYYKNLLIKGMLYAVTGLTVTFLAVAVLEYYGNFNSIIRALLFYSFIAFSVYVLFRYIAIPLTGLFRIGKVISYTQASEIIGNHFSEVKDKLLNVLQLQMDMDSVSRELIEASINQKTAELKPLPFTSAINLKANYKYARYAALPLLAFVAVLFLAPSIIKESSNRLVHYNTYFAPKAPFQFVLLNKELNVLQQQDFELQLKTSGNILPEEVFVEVNGTKFKMQRNEKNLFTYTFRNTQDDITFRFFADDFYSDNYELDVLAKPNLRDFSVALEYPTYLGKKNETLSNAGDLTVPAGTRISWSFNTANVNTLQLAFPDVVMSALAAEKNRFTVSRKFLRSSSYAILTANAESPKGDSMVYAVQVIPDEYPVIQVQQRADSIQNSTIYFTGELSDDHGLKKLMMHYSLKKKDGQPQVQSNPVPLRQSGNRQSFFHVFDVRTLNIEPGDEVEYYFEVWDNDGVTGSKATRSQAMLFKAPTKQEIKENAESSSRELKNKITEAIQEAKSLQKEMKDLQQKMLDKKELSWEEKKKMEELIKREKELEKKINSMEQLSEQKMQQQQEFSKQDEEIVQKQQELQKMWDEVLNEDIKKMIQQMEQLMKMNNKDALQQKMEEMELSNKEVEKELDRMLELYKKLEIEQKLKENVDELKKLSDEQQKLSEQTKEKTTTPEGLKQKQEEIKKNFEELKKDLQKLEQKNEQLEEPEQMPDTKEEQQQIEQNMEDSEEQLNKGNNKKASESQKKSGQKMKEMAEKMQQNMEQSEKEEQEENYEALRMLLENLIQLSKDQEDLMQQMGSIQGYNPQYVKMGQRQKEIRDNARMIEDSLYALSKRVPQIRSYINRELGQVNYNMDKALKGFSDREVGETRKRQQFVMTSVNNIAVMMSEILKQMQQDMNSNASASGSGKGKKKSKKPGNSQSLSELMKMQQQLNEMMKQGQNPGGKQGQGMGSKQFAEMAAKQAAIRRQLQQMQQQMQKEGKGAMGNQLQQIQQMMEKTEKDLVNKKFNTETINRQQEILTRMLESEKAEKEREQDNKRESKTANEKTKALPPDLEEYLKQKSKEQELLLTIPPALQPFYKDKTKEYFNKLGNP